MIEDPATPQGYANFGKHWVYKYSGKWWFTCGTCVSNKPTDTWRQAMDLLHLHVDDHVRAHRPR